MSFPDASVVPTPTVVLSVVTPETVQNDETGTSSKNANNLVLGFILVAVNVIVLVRINEAKLISTVLSPKLCC